jgi:prevent-host-death family protein
MTIIGARDLRQKTSEVLRRIREEQAEYIITYQGKPVAILLPLDVDAVEQAIPDVGDVGKEGAACGWDAYAQVATTVRERWPQSLITETVLDKVRR